MKRMENKKAKISSKAEVKLMKIKKKKPAMWWHCGHTRDLLNVP
jgi:hypothetical protein